MQPEDAWPTAKHWKATVQTWRGVLFRMDHDLHLQLYLHIRCKKECAWSVRRAVIRFCPRLEKQYDHSWNPFFFKCTYTQRNNEQARSSSVTVATDFIARFFLSGMSNYARTRTNHQFFTTVQVLIKYDIVKIVREGIRKNRLLCSQHKLGSCLNQAPCSSLNRKPIEWGEIWNRNTWALQRFVVTQFVIRRRIQSVRSLEILVCRDWW